MSRAAIPMAWLGLLALLTGCPTPRYGDDDDDDTGDDDSGGDDDATGDDDTTGDDDVTADDDSAGDDDTTVEVCEAFSFVERSEESCPWEDPGGCGEDLGCADWPTPAAGTVWRYTSTEERGADTWERTFHVYEPAGIAGPVPVVILLHGGTEDGLQFLTYDLARMADQGGETPGAYWFRNNEDCQYQYTSLLDMGFENPVTGFACVPDLVNYTNAQRYLAVMPDGLLDDGDACSRHWEDGRTPSPGWGTTDEHRDDVGFLDHIVATLLAEQGDLVDPERIHLMGASNGGMMTQRVMCNADNGFYPNLGGIASYTAIVASMPEPIALGLDGRPQCPASGALPLPVLYIAGNGIDTPDCEPYPCFDPVTNGDRLMPYGEAGNTYFVASPFGGRVIAADDAHQHWIDYDAGGPAPPTQVEQLGYFTEIRTTEFAGTDAQVVVFDTDRGYHMLSGTRMDFAPAGRALDYALRYRRLPDGTVQRAGNSPLAGEF